MQAVAEPSIYIHQILSTVNTSGSFNLFDLGLKKAIIYRVR
jgi:hypothetical protein